jgi:hypothetical protein
MQEAEYRPVDFLNEQPLHIQNFLKSVPLPFNAEAGML